MFWGSRKKINPSLKWSGVFKNISLQISTAIGKYSFLRGWGWLKSLGLKIHTNDDVCKPIYSSFNITDHGTHRVLRPCFRVDEEIIQTILSGLVRCRKKIVCKSVQPLLKKWYNFICRSISLSLITKQLKVSTPRFLRVSKYRGLI